MTLAEWETYCQRRGVMVLAAEEEGDLAGWAVAESCPQRLHIRTLEGDRAACRLLLNRLVMAAGERDLSGWVPLDRPDLRRMFRRLGFVLGGTGHHAGTPSSFYAWNRNADL
jgi:L-amino acid N-acyltransferase YncA